MKRILLNVFDKFLILVYILLLIYMSYLFYFMSIEIFRNGVPLRISVILLLLSAIMLYVWGATSLFEKGLMPYLYYREPALSSDISLKNFTRLNTGMLSVLIFSFLILISHLLFYEFRWLWVGRWSIFAVQITVIIYGVKKHLW